MNGCTHSYGLERTYFILNYITKKQSRILKILISGKCNCHSEYTTSSYDRAGQYIGKMD